MVEQHVVDEQAVDAVQLADHLARDLLAVLVDHAERLRFGDQVREQLDALAALALGQQQVVDHRDDVEAHRRRQRLLGLDHALLGFGRRSFASVQIGQADREHLLGGDLGLAAQLGRLDRAPARRALGVPDDVLLALRLGARARRRRSS